jgi:hypothetical protein
MKIITLKTDPEKAECLDACSKEGLTLGIFHDENPEGLIKIPAMIQKMGERKYVVAPPYSHEHLQTWLHLGNWQAVYPEDAEYDFFNTFKSSEGEIEEFLDENGIELWIDSFYDDTEWKVVWNTP